MSLRTMCRLAGLALAVFLTVSPSARADMVDDCVKGSPDVAISGCTKAIQSGQWPGAGIAWAYTNRGNAYLNKIDLDRAIADLNTAIKLDPKSSVALNDRGLAYEAKGDLDRAMADYDAAIRANPKSDLALAYRGSLYITRRDPAKAIADLDNAIRINPKSVFALITRGNAYMDKGDRQRAIPDYDAAIRINPNSDRAYAGRCTAYMQLGDEDKAIADCSTAIKLAPQSAEAYYRRGDAYSFRNEYDKAIADFDAAIRLEPKFIGPWYDRANALFFKGEADRAIEGYTGLLAFAPKFDAAFGTRGAVHLYKWDLDLALTDYDSALALSSRDEYLWFRALIRRLKGDSARALADFNRLAEQSADDARWALWLEIAGREAGVSSRLAEAVKHLDMTAWPAPVVRLFLGQLTPDAVLAAADDKDAGLKQDQMCEARTFIGELDLIQGRKDAALDGFRAAAKECSYVSFEIAVARSELRRAGVAP